MLSRNQDLGCPRLLQLKPVLEAAILLIAASLETSAFSLRCRGPRDVYYYGDLASRLSVEDYLDYPDDYRNHTTLDLLPLGWSNEMN